MNKIEKAVALVDNDLFCVVGALESIENSLYFAEEIPEKSVATHSAKAIELVVEKIEAIQNKLSDIERLVAEK